MCRSGPAAAHGYRSLASGPSGALHTSGAWSLMLLGALACCLARPCCMLWASRGSRALSFGVVWCVLLQTSSIQGVFRVDFCPVVTNVVNPSAFSLKMLVFGLRLTTFVTEVLARRFELRWFDDVCNVGRPLVARPGPASAHGYRSLVLHPSGTLHTSGAFAAVVAWRVDSLSGQAPPSPINFARNSPVVCSNSEFASLELQRFWGVSKSEHDKLRAKFGWRWCWWFQRRHVVAPRARKSSPCVA